ncbi:MAG: molybdopterin molybdenumtransferase MoeA [Acidobacteria bacterium]|nr:MAG: molybdopterin molybdenumtransferase MoeA [Acidobacteriota bacterium]
MLVPEQAWRRIDRHLSPLPPESVSRADACGRVLAEALAATADLPPADVSAMDGYVCAGPVAAGSVLPVAGTVTAGRPPSFRLQPGTAAKIMTGAVVPDGGDRVVPVEETDGGDRRVRIDVAPPAGAHIRRRAEVLARGAPLLAAGERLTPAGISLLAAHGYAAVKVHRRPSVATLATGDEVVPPEVEPAAGQLRDSNSAFLAAALGTLGIAPHALGIAPDEPSALRRLIRQGLTRDVLLLSGGVSMGELDLVEDVLAELGCTAIFDRVAMQPGKPLVAARHAGGWVFGLPGNPASVMVGFWLFVRPLLRRLMGLADGFWHGALAAELTAPLRGAKGRDRFLAAKAAIRRGRLFATPLPPRGSHDVAAYGRGSVLLRIPADAEAREAGAPCEILPLVDWPGDP